MALGIDFGASSTKAVLLEGKKILKKAISEKPLRGRQELESFLKRNNFPARIHAVAITGGKSAFFKSKLFGVKPVAINEIGAIGAGASFLSGKKSLLAVSMGTGTCIVFFCSGRARHVIGSGVGGGTILGLSSILLNETGIASLNSLAAKGDLSRVDLSVRDIVGKGIGKLGGNATAANLAKMHGARKEDLAAGIQNLVAESAGVLAVSTAMQCGCKEIVFTGRVPEFSFVKKRLLAAARMFNSKFLFPKGACFATAVGAALLAKK